MLVDHGEQVLSCSDSNVEYGVADGIICRLGRWSPVARLLLNVVDPYNAYHMLVVKS